MAAELRSRFKLRFVSAAPSRPRSMLTSHMRSSKDGDNVTVEVLLLVSKSKSEPACTTPAQLDKHYRVWCGLDTGDVEVKAPCSSLRLQTPMKLLRPR